MTWLEQGREINVSVDVLAAIATTLRLSDDEGAYLFALAGFPIPKIVVDAGNVPERVITLVDSIRYPACILNYRFRVAHLNALGARYEAQTLLLNENADVSVYIAVPVENRSLG